MSDQDRRKKYDIEKEERSSSPEKLNESIRVGNAGGFLLIAAMIIAAVALIVWGFVGRIPVTETESVAVVGDEEETDMCVGFMDVHKNVGVLPAGTEVNIRMPDGVYVKGVITSMTSQPLSSEEIRGMYGEDNANDDVLSDWMLGILLEEDSCYSYMFFIETQEDVSEYWHQIAEASIITDEIPPISLLTR